MKHRKKVLVKKVKKVFVGSERKRLSRHRLLILFFLLLLVAVSGRRTSKSIQVISVICSCRHVDMLD